MSKQLWWIERKDGTLAQLGRWPDEYERSRITEGGGPNLAYYKYQAQRVCRKGERPVKVRVVRDKGAP